MPDIGAPGGPMPGQPAVSTQGRPFIAVLQDDDLQYAAELAALLSSLAGPDVRVIRIGGPSRSHQTLERMLAPAVNGDSAPRLADNARLIARTIAERQGQETRVVLLIRQAERLQPAVLRALQAMAPYFVDAGKPTLQVAFIGLPEFRELLEAGDLAPLRSALGIGLRHRREVPEAFPIADSGTSVQMRDTPQAPFSATVPGDAARSYGGARLQPEPAAANRTGFRSGRYLRRLLVRSLLATMVLAVLGWAAYAGLHRIFYRDAPSRAIALAPVQTEPMVAAPPSETIEAQTSAPAAPATDRRQPVSKPPPDEPAKDQAASPRSGPRTVIHIPADSAAAAALSAKLLRTLGARPGKVEARVVADAPTRPNIRYFHPEDEAVAKQVAAWMADTGLDWALRDFSMFQPRPSRGTIEVWLPRVP